MVRPDRERLSGSSRSTRDHRRSNTRAQGRFDAQGAGDDRGRTTGKRALGRVRLAVAEAPNTNESVEFACQVVEPGSTIRTDGARGFRKLETMGYAHDYVTVYNSADAAHELLPGVHMVSSLLKRWIADTHHQRISDKHLPYYLDEYTFRFNRRKSRARELLSTGSCNKPSRPTRTRSVS